MPAVLNVDGPVSSRVSHVLPTVKCSTCAQSVPFSQLTDHVCAPPPSPVTPRTPRTPTPMSPGSYSPRSPQAEARIQSPIRDVRPPALNLNLAAQAPFPMIATPSPRREDYMPGGASGMAGVGRRAFQAVAHAALFAQHHHSNHAQPASSGMPIRVDARGANITQYLNTSSGAGSGKGTPPLSPNSTLSSPRSHSPLTPSLYHPTLTTATTPTSFTFPTNSNLARPATPPLSPSNYDNMTSRLPFFQQRYKNEMPPATSSNDSSFNGRNTPRAGAIPPPSPSDYDSDGDGLAYDRDDDEDEITTGLSSKRGNDTRFGNLRKEQDFGRVSRNERERSREQEQERERSRGQDRDRRRQDTEQDRAKNNRDRSASTERSRRRDEMDKLSLPRERERTRDRERDRTKADDDRSRPTERSARRNESSPPPRSRVSPSSRSNVSGSSGSSAGQSTQGRDKDQERAKRKQTTRVCLRCELKIENSRWVKTDDGRGVLCERCWKNMYLPRCRRCDKHIETAAVYSSDGQLKGKYHRECFTCATCDLPFPDKSFYVFDGQPYCQFHYATLNNSLCSRRQCAKPIEGPCAINYSGDKYHPDCMRCGQVGCEIRLGKDYWEVDGMMLCERHGSKYATSESSESDYGEEEREQDWRRRERERERERDRRRKGASSGKARKRTTRLINLDGGRG